MDGAAGMTTKRYRRRNAKPGQLLAYFGKLPGDNPDIVYAWGGDGATKRHGNLMHYLFGTPRVELLHGDAAKKEGHPWRFGKSLLQELEAAGCDLTTLRFSIEMKPAAIQSCPPTPEHPA